MGWTEYAQWHRQDGVKLLAQCGVCSGMKVLDFGCSIGEYSIPASIAVGESGAVVAVDKCIHPLKVLRAACAAGELHNIHIIKGTECSKEIHEITYDCVLYFDLYHSMGRDPLVRSAENQRILRAITLTCRQGGLLLVSVFSEMCLIWDEVNGKRTPKGFLKGQKVSIQEGIRWFRMLETIEECGFKLQSVVAGAIHFDMFYKKGEPDMDSFERGDIYVFKKVS